MRSLPCQNCGVNLDLIVVRVEQLRTEPAIEFVRRYENCRGCGALEIGFLDRVDERDPVRRREFEELIHWFNYQSRNNRGRGRGVRPPSDQYASVNYGEVERRVMYGEVERRVMGRFGSDRPQIQTLGRQWEPRLDQMRALIGGEGSELQLHGWMRVVPSEYQSLVVRVTSRVGRQFIGEVNNAATRERLIHALRSEIISEIQNQGLRGRRADFIIVDDPVAEPNYLAVDIETRREQFNFWSSDGGRPRQRATQTRRPSMWAYLKDRQVIECTLEEWASSKGDNRVVKQTVFAKGEMVSTVFLGLNSGFLGTPLWFETMSFTREGCEFDQFQERHESYSQSVKAHDKLVKRMTKKYGKGISRGDHMVNELTINRVGRRKMVIDDE